MADLMKLEEIIEDGRSVCLDGPVDIPGERGLSWLIRALGRKLRSSFDGQPWPDMGCENDYGIAHAMIAMYLGLDEEEADGDD